MRNPLNNDIGETFLNIILLYRQTMLVEDYRKYYLDLTQGVMSSHSGHFQITLEKDDPKKITYQNYQRGLTILALISLIESNFLTKPQVRALRKFEVVPDLNNSINQEHLSCFIYLRDCYAHNPFSKLLPAGGNTDKFREALNSDNFPFAQIQEDDVHILNTHELHLLVLRFYDQPV
jgi:hypothetical protein